MPSLKMTLPSLLTYLKSPSRKKRWISIVSFMTIALIGVGAWLFTPDLNRSELTRRYAAPPSEFLEVLGVRLHVRDTGPKAAPTLILLHGFGASLHTWDAWASVLERNFRVVRFDLPGAALTGPDPSGDYRDARSVAILNALMDRLGIEKASFVGNSMGGRLAWWFAAKNPARVNKLVLISPDGFASPGFAYGQAPDVPFTLELMRFVLPRSLLRANLVLAYADPTRLSAEQVATYYDLMRAPGVRSAMLDRLRQTILQPPLPVLRTIQAPTLLLWGQQDAMIPISNAQDYLAAIPNCELVVLPHLGHVPQEEDPAVSLAPVVEFLKPRDRQAQPTS
jgi:pimeloyl-ACP methyl ester carboxylesterase